MHWFCQQLLLPLPEHQSLGSHHKPSRTCCWFSRGAPASSLFLPCSSSGSPARCSMTWTSLGSHRRGEEEYNCLPGKGIHSLALLAPEPATGIKDSTEKLESQRITSAAGVEAGMSLTYSSWFIDFPINSPIAPVYFLFLPLCIQTVSYFHLPIPSIISMQRLFQCTSGTSSLFL